MSFFLKVNRSIQKDKLITIDTYNDHRIALSFSILVFLGLKLKINNSDVINKSYPDFFTDLIKFGVLINKPSNNLAKVPELPAFIHMYFLKLKLFKPLP